MRFGAEKPTPAYARVPLYCTSNCTNRGLPSPVNPRTTVTAQYGINVSPVLYYRCINVPVQAWCTEEYCSEHNFALLRIYVNI